MSNAKQALRLRRFAFACLNHLLATALIAAAWAFDALPGMVVANAAAAFIVINLAVYAAIRSGLNLRAADPSLTSIQMLASISVLMYVVYHMDHGRDVALFGCFIVFLSGVFRLGAREFTGVTLYTLAAYALVIDLLVRWRPSAVVDVQGEWMSWVGLAGFLPCFVVIGGQIHALRRRLRERDAHSLSLAEMSSDFHWETDAAHRLSGRDNNDAKAGARSVLVRGVRMGERRWDVPSISPDEAGWRDHRAKLDARLPFRDFESSRRGIDGTERHLSLSGDPVFGESGEFKGYRGVGRDISERKRAEQALRDSVHQLRVFADNVPAMTTSWDLGMHCSFANKAFAEFFGLPIDGIVGLHARDVFGEQGYAEAAPHFASALKGYPVTYQRTHGSRHLEDRLLPDIGENGKLQGCFAVTTDITRHKRAEEHSRNLAHHDSLTGLPNRLLFDDRLAQAISDATLTRSTFALLFLDLDKFKPVNDALGHAAGDELLKGVAARISLHVRGRDTVARVGGDEFTVILKDIRARADAEAVAAKISAALMTPFPLGSPLTYVEIGTSVGIAIYPEDARNADDLMSLADAAMYRSKQRAATPDGIAATVRESDAGS